MDDETGQDKTGRDKTERDQTEHGIVLVEQSQEQPKNKKRGQSSGQTEKKEDELQPIREKSGF